MKNAFFIVFFALFMTPLSIFSQSYGTALGVRLDGFGVTLQQQVGVGKTVEFILQTGGFGKQDIIASGLFEVHKGILTQNLNFYLGGGVFKKWYDRDVVTQKDLKNPWGVSPIMGLELNIGKIVLSGDIKPNLKLGGDSSKALEMHTGISIRYELAGRYFKNDDWKFWKKWKKKK
jgi:hypothetical protein